MSDRMELSALLGARDNKAAGDLSKAYRLQYVDNLVILGASQDGARSQL